MADVLLLLLGSVVGAAGSIGGSLILGRRELTRSARIRIYRDLLPSIVDATLDAPPWSTPVARSSMEALYREAVLAGRRDGAMAERAVDAWVARAAVRVDDQVDQEGNVVTSGRSIADWAGANQALLGALVDLDTFVKAKIR